MKTIKITPNLARIQFDSMEEWLVNRKGIGGSDASAILGLNPYKTNQELWMQIFNKIKEKKIILIYIIAIRNLTMPLKNIS